MVHKHQMPFLFKLTHGYEATEEAEGLYSSLHKAAPPKQLVQWGCQQEHLPQGALFHLT